MNWWHFLLIFLCYKLFPTRWIAACNHYVLGVPTYLPFGWLHFYHHLLIYISQSKHSLNDGNKLYGINAKSLFITALKAVQPSDKKLKILATPIHHKSFVTIMEKMFDTEISILELTDDFTKIIIDENLIEKCDIIVVTHLFGRCFDLKYLSHLKRKYNKILIVDSVLAGENSFNTEIDVNIYSCGQDKRPVSFGGGYCCVNNPSLKNKMIKILYSYPEQSSRQRLFKLLNTMTIYTLYMNRNLHLLIFFFLRLTGIKLSSVVKTARKTNSGFELPEYLLRPNYNFCSAIYHETCNNYSCNRIENIYSISWVCYLRYFPPEMIKELYPYYTGCVASNPIILPYNQIRIPENQVEQFIDFCDNKMITATKNDNYSCMSICSEKYHRYMREMVNITSPINESSDDKNIKILAYHLKEWYYTYYHRN